MYNFSDANVINLHGARQRLTFGAQVEKNGQTEMKISKGLAACFRVFTVDGK